VPLLLRWPGHLPAGRVVDGLARHIDVAPTLLDLAGPPELMPCEGVSLRSRIEGQEQPITDAILACESSWQSALALRMADWKLIWQRPYQDSSTFELYDLAADPAEVRDLASEQPDRVGRLATRLEQMVEAELARGGHSVNPMRTEGLTLRSLYVKAETPEALREQVIELLQEQGKLPHTEVEGYSPAEEAIIQNRLRNLGYL
jgi:arylsulfatase